MFERERQLKVSDSFQLHALHSSSADGTDATQINKVITHPALPLLITAHEDKFIRMFDLNTGEYHESNSVLRCLCTISHLSSLPLHRSEFPFYQVHAPYQC